jgi:hypothetical protein
MLNIFRSAVVLLSLSPSTVPAPANLSSAISPIRPRCPTSTEAWELIHLTLWKRGPRRLLPSYPATASTSQISDLSLHLYPYLSSLSFPFFCLPPKTIVYFCSDSRIYTTMMLAVMTRRRLLGCARAVLPLCDRFSVRLGYQQVKFDIQQSRD